MKNPRKFLLILGISCIILGIACVVTGSIFEIIGNVNLCKLFLIIAGGIGAVAFIILIFGFVFFGVNKKPQVEPMPQVKKDIGTVDVKEAPKSKEENLFEEYKKLYEQGLITKEDLDAKEKELLHK